MTQNPVVVYSIECTDVESGQTWEVVKEYERFQELVIAMPSIVQSSAQGLRSVPAAVEFKSNSRDLVQPLELESWLQKVVYHSGGPTWGMHLQDFSLRPWRFGSGTLAWS